MNRNAESLKAKARKCKVIQVSRNGQYVIESPSGSQYSVDLNYNRCNCKFKKYHPYKACVHLIAARWDWEKFNTRRTISVWDNDTDAKRQHRPVAQFCDMKLTYRNTKA